MTNRGMILCALLLAAPTGCAYNTYDTARMLPKGATSVGGAVASYGYHEGGNSGDDEAFELMGSHALSEKLELGGKFAWFGEQGTNFFNLLVVTKYSLIPDQLALNIPAGIIIGTSDDAGTETENIWRVAPGVVFTLPLQEMFDLNLGGRPELTLADDFSDYNLAMSATVGLRLKPPGQSWSLQPEVGFMFDDDSAEPGGDTGYFLSFGLAFNWAFGATNPGATPAPAPAPAPAPPPP